MEITDEKTGRMSTISRTYRLTSGDRLFVGGDRIVWLGCGEQPQRYSLIGRIADDQPITKDAACRAANCR